MISMFFLTVFTISFITIKGESINELLKDTPINCMLLQDEQIVYSLYPLTKKDK